MPMTETKPINLRMPEPIKTAVEAHCKKKKLNRSKFILAAICDAIGKPELMEHVRPANRPKNDVAD